MRTVGLTLCDSLESDGLSVPTFRSSCDHPESGEKGVIPLQAADFAAYEFFRLYGKFFSESVSWPLPEPRKSWVRLVENVDLLHHYYTEFMISSRCDERGVPKRG